MRTQRLFILPLQIFGNDKHDLSWLISQFRVFTDRSNKKCPARVKLLFMPQTKLFSL
jgi:hypothetical protein